MTTQKVKEILISIRTLTYYRQCYKEELAEMIEAEQLTSQYDKIRVQTSGTSDKVPSVADKLRKAYADFERAWEQEQELYDIVGEAIDNLPPELYRIVKDRYTRNKTTRNIARRLYCDHSTVVRKEAEAIRRIVKYINCTKCTK